jgi:hypothetical protein
LTDCEGAGRRRRRKSNAPLLLGAPPAGFQPRWAQVRPRGSSPSASLAWSTARRIAVDLESLGLARAQWNAASRKSALATPAALAPTAPAPRPPPCRRRGRCR